MPYDNQVFNVNGDSEELLLQTLELAFAQGDNLCVGWNQTIEHGLELMWAPDTHTNLFPSRLSAKECAPMVVQWLKGEFASKVVCEGLDANIDQDGHNERNWRVYLDDKEGYCPHGIICRVKPAYTWYGK